MQYIDDLGFPRAAVVLVTPDGRQRELRPGTFAGSHIGRYYLNSSDRMPPKLEDILEQIEVVRSEPARPVTNDPRMLTELPRGHVLEDAA